MQRSVVVVGFLAAMVIFVSAYPAACQTDKDDVAAVVNGMIGAIAKPDWAAVGQAISDSGFVGVMDLGEDAKCYAKNDWLAYLQGLVPAGGLGDALKVEDLKVEVHFTVAFANANLTLPPQSPLQRAFLDAVLFREMGKWQVCALMVAPEEAKPDEETVKTVADRAAALATAAKTADTDPLQKALDDDHFVLCYIDPSMELRWSSSKAALIGMLQGVLGMVTINQSQLDITRAQTGKTAAVVDGTWLIDITDFGQTTSAVRAYAVKTGGEWKIVTLAGGPKG